MACSGTALLFLLYFTVNNIELYNKKRTLPERKGGAKKRNRIGGY
jgi:hypothetical protein